MEKTYTIAGTSVVNGIKTYRFANGKLNKRRIMLKHHKHEDIQLQELKSPMTKVQAIAFLVQQGVEGAVIFTRAKDKTRKTTAVVEGEKLAARRMKDRARKATRKQAA